MYKHFALWVNPVYELCHINKTTLQCIYKGDVSFNFYNPCQKAHRVIQQYSNTNFRPSVASIVRTGASCPLVTAVSAHIRGQWHWSICSVSAWLHGCLTQTHLQFSNELIIVCILTCWKRDYCKDIIAFGTDCVCEFSKKLINTFVDSNLDEKCAMITAYCHAIKTVMIT